MNKVFSLAMLFVFIPVNAVHGLDLSSSEYTCEPLEHSQNSEGLWNHNEREQLGNLLVAAFDRNNFDGARNLVAAGACLPTNICAEKFAHAVEHGDDNLIDLLLAMNPTPEIKKAALLLAIRSRKGKAVKKLVPEVSFNTQEAAHWEQDIGEILDEDQTPTQKPSSINTFLNNLNNYFDWAYEALHKKFEIVDR